MSLRVCVIVFVCDGGEGGGVSEPALVRVPLGAWLCVFLCGGKEVRWSDVGGVRSRSSNAVSPFISE